jgi:hypothetical protein
MLIGDGATISVEVHPNGRAKVPVVVWRGEETLLTDCVNLIEAGKRAKLIERLPEDTRDEAAGLLAVVALDLARGERRDETPSDREPTRPESLRATGALVLDAPNILALAAERVKADGYAGVPDAPKIIFLAITSRLQERPLNLCIEGSSAAGKNFAVQVSARLFPASAYHDLTGCSPRALVYSRETFEHRTLIIAESAALHQDGIGASIMRAVAWDNRIVYETVIDGKPVRLEKEGPTGLITTTTHELEPELSTRLWRVPIPDDAEQTKSVMKATATRFAGITVPAGNVPSLVVFQAAQQWLAVAGVRDVVVPFAIALAFLIQSREVRMRRDFTQLLTLIQTHAMLHQCTRDRDADGRIIATISDYTAIRDLVAPVFAGSVSSGVTDQVRAAVTAVATMTQHQGDEVTVSALADDLGLSPSGAWYRVRRALAGGWLINLERRPHHPARLEVGDPLPEDLPVLPEPEQVLERWGMITESALEWG